MPLYQRLADRAMLQTTALQSQMSAMHNPFYNGAYRMGGYGGYMGGMGGLGGYGMGGYGMGGYGMGGYGMGGYGYPAYAGGVPLASR